MSKLAKQICHGPHGARRSLRWLLGQGRLLRCMALGAFLALIPGLGHGQVGGTYWQCVAPSTTNPQGAYCPAGTTYPLPTAPSAASVGGASIFRSVTLTNTAVAVKASSGTVSLIHVVNQEGGAVNCYLQLYDVAAAGVTVGTTVPTITLNIPATTTLTLPISVPLQFSTAIAAAATTTPGGSTACSPILSTTLVGYK